MKYSISARQQKSYLSKADEILVECRDYKYIPDLFQEYPEKIIILDIQPEKFEEMQETIIQYSTCTPNFYCRLFSLLDYKWFKENNIKFFYRYPSSTMYEVQALAKLGVEYITISAPLTFKMNMLKRFNYDYNPKIKFRMVPNICYDAYIPRENGLLGQWVRPEDVKHYEESVYIFDFEDCDLVKERALYHIYAEEKHWDGNLNLLLTNFGIDADNRAIIESLGAYRSNCGQNCMNGDRCTFCQTALKFEKNIRNLAKEKRKEIIEEKNKVDF